MNVQIRRMNPEDISALTTMEKDFHELSWSETSFLNEINLRCSLCLTAHIEELVVGFLCARVIIDEAHLLNIAVSRGYRQKGIGSFMMRQFIEELRSMAVSTIFLETRGHNITALRLYESYGFMVIAKKKDYYINPEDDCIVMRAELR